MDLFLSALFLQAGYNTALVTVGAALLGAAAGAVGAFVLLRKRALVSDAISHATLPGLALAFIVMAGTGGDGRWLPGLMIGAGLSAALGLVVVDWLTARTRLTEDAAIGAVLSVFFGAGVVLMTVIQTLDSGQQAGISGYLLGATAGMLRAEAQIIAVAAAATALAVFLLRKPFTLVAFDPDYAVVRGVNPRLADLALMALLMAVTVIGLKVAGLVLIVALTIIPPVAARFWTDRPGSMVLIAAGLGAVAAWLGAVTSALDQGLPTGALIVLYAAGLFALSLALSPRRGLVAGLLARLRFRRTLRAHDAQRARMRAGETVADLETDDARWRALMRFHPAEAALARPLVPLADQFPAALIARLDAERAA